MTHRLSTAAQPDAGGKDFIEGLNPNSLKVVQAVAEALLAVAHEGEYWRPTCASCGIKLLERTPAKGGAAFWGCSNYPRCKSRLPMLAATR